MGTVREDGKLRGADGRLLAPRTALMLPVVRQIVRAAPAVRTLQRDLWRGMRTMEARKPFMIGVAGGTASGKSTVRDLLMEKLGQHEVNMDEKQVVHLSQDSFYRELTHAESEKAKKGMFNFDHPNAFDHELMELCLQQILAGRPTQVPVYDFKTNARVPGIVTTIYPSDVVLVEGILVFYYANMRNLFDLKLFVDTDADIRLARRVMRDIEDRGRDLEHVLHQYTTLIKQHIEFVICKSHTLSSPGTAAASSKPDTIYERSWSNSDSTSSSR